jgi:NAD(P)-dependent dehydrogenase (short-subunit alcohol dehydrogenase family)
LPRTVLITGSTDGLGLALARALIAEGDSVLVHGRDPEKVERVAVELGAARAYVADLASLAQVRRLADELERVDVLVNNAGIISQERRLSEDGHELTFAVNHLAHFLLTGLLLPTSRPTRVVNVASAGQTAIDFDDVMLERGYDAIRAYYQSKLAQVMFTFDLAERLGAPPPAVNALHPATLMDTKMVRESYGSVMSSVEEGVAAVKRLVTDPELDGVTGRYFDGLNESRAHSQAYDAEARDRLWALSEELTGFSYP